MDDKGNNKNISGKIHQKTCRQRQREFQCVDYFTVFVSLSFVSDLPLLALAAYFPKGASSSVYARSLFSAI